MAALLRAYNSALLRRPMLTQCATAATLYGAGDVLAQQAFERKEKNHDYARTARVVFYGGALFAPILTRWYRVLGRLKFRSPTTATVTRVALDQSVMAPAIVGFFYTSMTLLEGKGLMDVRKRLESAYVPTIIRGWGVFLPTQIINFTLVPIHLRFVFVSVVAMFWNSYLSHTNANHVSSTPEMEDITPLQ